MEGCETQCVAFRHEIAQEVFIKQSYLTWWVTRENNPSPCKLRDD